MTRPARKTAPMSLLALAVTAAGCGPLTADGWLYQPFSGPGYAEETGLDTGLPDDHRYVVGTTYIAVKPESQQLFTENADAVFTYLDGAPEGLVGYARALKLGSNEYRTLTVWESYDAMYAFVLGDVHATAMGHVDEIADDEKPALVLSWEAGADEVPPTWSEAVERLDADGRAAY